MVPVVESGKVVSVLKVPRKEKKVYFIYTSSPDEISFFQNLISSRHKKVVENEASGLSARTECTIKTFVTWMPDNESNPDPSSGSGHWQYQNVTTCKVFNDLCAGYLDENGNCAGFDGGGYDYGGGDGGDEPGEEEEPENPCKKIQAQTSNAVYKSKVDFLKGKTNESFEYGFRVGNTMSRTNQMGAQYQQLSNAVGSNTLNFKIFNNTFGFMHSHFEGLIPVFSPDDINNFIKMLINSANHGMPLDTVYMTLVNPDGTTYQLWGSNDIDITNLSIFDQTTIDDVLNGVYTGNKYDLAKPNQSSQFYQENFLKFMRDKMNVDGAKMYSVDNNGNASQLH